MIAVAKIWAIRIGILIKKGRSINKYHKLKNLQIWLNNNNLWIFLSSVRRFGLRKQLFTKLKEEQFLVCEKFIVGRAFYCRVPFDKRGRIF